MANITIATIIEDTFTSIALSRILHEYFGIIPTALSKLDNSENDSFDIYVVTSDIMIKYLDFFIPRRNKTIVITNERITSAESHTISRYADEETIYDTLKSTIEKIKERIVAPHSELSAREIEVLALVATGNLNKEIADKLNISINTVLTHRKNITAKLGIRSVSGLSFYAMMNGYISNI